MFFNLKILAILCILTTVMAPSKLAIAQNASNLICNGCVNSKDIQNGQVKNGDLAKNAVDGSKIKSNSVSSTDLSNEPGANFAGGNNSFDLTTEDQTILSVSITAPSSGLVIVNAAGTFNFLESFTNLARCSITSSTDVRTSKKIRNDRVVATGEPGRVNQFVPFSALRGFEVEKGTNTYNLVCDQQSDTRVIRAQDVTLSALYVPTRY